MPIDIVHKSRMPAGARVTQMRRSRRRPSFASTKWSRSWRVPLLIGRQSISSSVQWLWNVKPKSVHWPAVSAMAGAVSALAAVVTLGFSRVAPAVTAPSTLDTHDLSESVGVPPTPSPTRSSTLPIEAPVTLSRPLGTSIVAGSRFDPVLVVRPTGSLEGSSRGELITVVVANPGTNPRPLLALLRIQSSDALTLVARSPSS